MERSLPLEKGFINAQILVKDYHITDILAGFIASGVEMAFRYFTNDGNFRVDGKLVVGQLINTGTIKVIGTIETEPIFL